MGSTTHSTELKQANEWQLLWHWLSEHFCPSRRVFLVKVQQRTEKPEEWQLKWPWPELYAIATFTSSHIIAKGVQKVVLSGHLNQSNRLSSPALPHKPSLLQPNLDFIPLFLSPSVNNAFVVTPFPHTFHGQYLICTDWQAREVTCIWTVAHELLAQRTHLQVKGLDTFPSSYHTYEKRLCLLIEQNNVKNVLSNSQDWDKKATGIPMGPC